jgi:hypothetical protein
VENLEQRALLSVTTVGEAFKTVAFKATEKVSGSMAGADVWGTAWQLPAPGKAPLKMVYDSATHGVLKTAKKVATFSSSGTWHLPAPYNRDGTWSVAGYIKSLTDNFGNIRGSAYVNKYTVTKNLIPINLSGNYTIKGKFSTKDYSLNLTFSSWQATFYVTGKLKPVNATNPSKPYPAFKVAMTSQWDQDEPGAAALSVAVTGLHKGVASESTPVTNVQLFWSPTANPNDPNRVSASAEKVGVYWNQATGEYVFSAEDLTEPPLEAEFLLFVAKYKVSGQTKTASSALALPAPTVAPAVAATLGAGYTKDARAFDLALAAE